MPLPLPSTSSAVHNTFLDHMGDESVCELLEVGLGMLARARLSDGLRNAAQSCVQALTRTCFLRLRDLGVGQVKDLMAGAKKLEQEKEARRAERKKIRDAARKELKTSQGQPNGQGEPTPKPERNSDSDRLPGDPESDEETVSDGQSGLHLLTECETDSGRQNQTLRHTLRPLACRLSWSYYVCSSPFSTRLIRHIPIPCGCPPSLSSIQLLK